MAVARSVGPTTRRNCGACHFKGGGGDAVKHGDLDGSMYYPSERIDVHMGRANLNCSDCHQAKEHRIPGCAMSVCVDRPSRVNCTDCHSEMPHVDQRLNEHIDTLSLSVRSRKCMERLGISSIGQLIGRTEAELLSAKNFGQTSLNEIKSRLEERGLRLKDSPY